MSNVRATSLTFVLAVALGSLVAGCGGGGGGGTVPTPSSTGGGPTSAQQTAPPNLPAKRTGVAVLGDDESGPGELQIATILDGSGNALAKPSLSDLPMTAMFDCDDVAITPDWSYGLVADGGRTLRVVSGLSSGSPSVSPYTLDTSAWATDLDSVRILQNGDEAVLAGDSGNSLLHVSGVLSGKPQAAETIPTPDLRDGLALSADGSVLLARGYSGLTVYSVSNTTPIRGPLGGWMYHSFSKTADLTTIPTINAADGRAGMAMSPADSSRAVVIGRGPAIALISGLPKNPVVQTPVAITGILGALAVAVSQDGTTAFVSADNGVVVFSGVNTGTLTQVQNATIHVGSDTLAKILTLAVTPDGKYLIAVGHLASNVSATKGDLVVLPITSSGLGAPVSVLTGLIVPGDDQTTVQ